MTPRTGEALVEGKCPTAFDYLGMHPLGTAGEGVVVRVFLTWAEEVHLLEGDTATYMTPMPIAGLFEIAFPDRAEFFEYRLRVKSHDGTTVELHDPYRFLPVLDEAALAPLAAGTERRAYRFLGARLTEHQGVDGACFAVWAPQAHNVNLMGEFNRWDARCHPMRPRGTTGVWELFVPQVGNGTHYKFDIRPTGTPRTLEKTDPYGRAMELRPQTASLVFDAPHAWGDGEWMKNRKARQNDQAPIAIYEVHLGSWRRKPDANPREGYQGWLNYRELAETLLPYVKERGFTHIELMPIAEHPLDKSWGYQTAGYFAPTSRFGTPDDFRHFVDTAHQLEIGVLVDWTPAHFPRDAHGLARFDGSPLYEHHDPRRGAHPDWGTLIFDYGRPEVAAFLISSAIYWIEELHVDGFRVDAVASMLYLDYSRGEGEWVPNEYGGREHLEAIDFLRALTDAVHEECDGALVIAEESTSWPKVSHATEEGGLGFDFKWNMGWMHDTLEVFGIDPLFRKGAYEKLTFPMWYASSERFLLPLSHDEVVHMKGSLFERMPGNEEARLANLRLLFFYMWAHPGKKLLFMGGEWGQPEEWNFDAQLNWPAADSPGHAGVRHLLDRLNQLYRTKPSLHQLDVQPDGFEWLDCHDTGRTTIAFIRWGKDFQHPVVVVANFTPMVWTGYQLPVPHAGRYQLLVNSASSAFGAPEGNELPAAFDAQPGEVHGRKHYVELDLPPYAGVMLEWRKDGESGSRGVGESVSGKQ
jgi:1,4-alpha-glucan branching enzyme